MVGLGAYRRIASDHQYSKPITVFKSSCTTVRELGTLRVIDWLADAVVAATRIVTNPPQWRCAVCARATLILGLYKRAEWS